MRRTQYFIIAALIIFTVFQYMRGQTGEYYGPHIGDEPESHYYPPEEQ